MSQRLAYFDASALAKRYTRESGTDFVNEIFRLLKSDSRLIRAMHTEEISACDPELDTLEDLRQLLGIEVANGER